MSLCHSVDGLPRTLLVLRLISSSYHVSLVFVSFHCLSVVRVECPFLCTKSLEVFMLRFSPSLPLLFFDPPSFLTLPPPAFCEVKRNFLQAGGVVILSWLAWRMDVHDPGVTVHVDLPCTLRPRPPLSLQLQVLVWHSGNWHWHTLVKALT